jgi:phosphatidylserine/phosphatidylglycerophosphate/cardiolipin synthase-like enzyme
MKLQITARSCFFFILVNSLFLTTCIPSPSDVPILLSVTSGTPTQPKIGWLEIYFTDPTAPRADEYEGGPDESLAAAIEKARYSIDLAAYSLNLWSIRDALIHAHQRGLVVRMVMESDNLDSQEVQQIREVGIPIIGDQREGLMHNKFVIIDRSEVWTGSMNYTTSGAYRDDNNIIRIRSTQVAEIYTVEFNEMFEENMFGPYVSTETPNPNLTIDGTPLEILFSPGDGVAARILDLLRGAEESIYFLAYTFTANDLGKAIIQRAADGLNVSGVMDDEQINYSQGSEYDLFLQAGLDVRRDGNSGLMHHKVLIIDRSIVITGSYNFSASAEQRNDENVVIFHDPKVAELFIAEFQRVYDQARQ